MTVETEEDSLALDGIQCENDSEVDFLSKELIIPTPTYDEKSDHSSSDDPSSTFRREANAASSLRVVYFSMVTTMAGWCCCLSLSKK